MKGNVWNEHTGQNSTEGTCEKHRIYIKDLYKSGTSRRTLGDPQHREDQKKAQQDTTGIQVMVTFYFLPNLSSFSVK